MIGAILIVVVLVVAIPVGVMMSGAVASMILGTVLRGDAADRHAGSELLDLNR